MLINCKITFGKNAKLNNYHGRRQVGFKYMRLQHSTQGNPHNGVRCLSSWENRRSQSTIYNYDVVAYQNVNVFVFHLFLTRKSLTITYTKVFYTIVMALIITCFLFVKKFYILHFWLLYRFFLIFFHTSSLVAASGRPGNRLWQPSVKQIAHRWILRLIWFIPITHHKTIFRICIQ